MGRKKGKYRKPTPQPAPLPTQNKPEWSAFKTFLLSIISALLIIVFAFLPYNRSWLIKRIYKYHQDFPEEIQNMDPDYRKSRKWGGEFNVAKALQGILDSTSVFLIPPQTYLIDNMFNEKNRQFHIWTYPSLLYYYVDDINLVDLRSPDSLVKRTTHTIWIRDQNGTKDVVISQMTSEEMLEPVLKEFRKYDLRVLFDPASAEKWLKANKNDSDR